MANLHLRDVDETLLEHYRTEARANKRSLQAELRDGLARGRPQRRLSREERVALSRKLTEGQVPTGDSTGYIRWLRDTDEGRYLGIPKPNAHHS